MQRLPLGASFLNIYYAHLESLGEFEMTKLVLSATIAAIALSPALAATPEETLASKFRAAEAYIDTKLTHESVSGAAIGFVYDQNLIWSYQYGVESYKTKKPVTDDTLFSICSVSKLFNGIAAMNLVDEGKLSLDAPLTQYEPALRIPDSLGSEEPVTVRGILSHVSGVPREGNRDYWADTSFPDSDGLVDLVQSQEQLYQPNEHWQYSNLGMSMLGGVIAKVSGDDWGDYIEKTIFKPLGMNNSTTDMPFYKVGNGFAQGYYVRSPNGERKAVEKHSFKSFAPAAGVASSVNDLAKFASWHFRLRENGGEEVLKATTLKNMQRIHWAGAEFDEPKWGLAYASTRYGDKTLWGHGGYCPGARTQFIMRLPEKIAGIMMVSANDIAPSAIVKAVYSLTAPEIAMVYASDEQEDADSSESSDVNKFAEYEGTYYQPNYPQDSYIGLNENGLFAISLMTENPAQSLENWEHVDGDTFVRKRKDGSDGEKITFERDKSGNVIGLMQHGYRSLKRN